MLQTVQSFSPHSLLQAKTPTPMPGGMGRRGGDACKKMRLEFLQDLTPPPPHPHPMGPQDTLGWRRWTLGFLVSRAVLLLESLTPAQASGTNIPSLPSAPPR